MQVVDLESESNRLKALVYGKSGTGKTSFGASAPRPLILLNELQAKPHVLAAARRLGRTVPDVLHMETTQDYRDVLRATYGPRDQPFAVRDLKGAVTFQMDPWPETLVLDSLTEACELISNEIREQSPPRTGKDGLPVDSERYWNVFFDRGSKLIRAFRDVDMNVLFLCLLDDRQVGEGDDAHRWVGPALAMRRLPGVVAAAVNVVGVTYRRLVGDGSKGDRGLEYGVATVGPEWMETKPLRPLRDYEVTDFSSWVARMSGEIAPPAPAPMTSVADAATAGAPAPEVKVDEPARKAPARKRSADGGAS
jgi:hypothetical protein